MSDTIYYTTICSVTTSYLLIGSSDFENLQPIAFENGTDVCLFTIDDEITLEYEDTVILRFTPDSPAFIPTVEGAGEFIRDTASLHIVDNDRKSTFMKTLNVPIITLYKAWLNSPLFLHRPRDAF